MNRGQMFARPTATPGQQVWTFSTTTSFSFIVPAWVFDISAVCVNYGKGVGTHARILRGATQLLGASQALGSGVGGGDGGNQGNSSDGATGGGPGGAGGYSGNGGPGAYAARLPTPGTYTPAAGSPGGGGGGGGGGTNGFGVGGVGGGVGLLGQGSNGTGGPANSAGGNGSQSPGSGNYGFGSENGIRGGGNLRWKNAIPVTPGETLTIAGSGLLAAGQLSAIRIMWGGGRSYPINAGNV